jgi:hypothetical protein
MVAHRKVARDGSTSQTRGTLFGARPNTAPPAPTTPAPTASAPPASASKASTRRTKPDWNHDCGLTEYGKTQTLIPKFDHWEWRLGGPTQSRTVTMSTLKPTSDPEAHRALRDYPFCPSRSSDFMTHAQRSVTGQAPLLRIAKDTTGANGARHASANRVHRARWKDQDRLAPIPKWPPEHSHGRAPDVHAQLDARQTLCPRVIVDSNPRSLPKRLARTRGTPLTVPFLRPLLAP